MNKFKYKNFFLFNNNRLIFRIVLFLLIIFSFKTFALDSEIKNQIYIGCYSNSQQYIGSEKSKIYCNCTIEKLSEKFTNNEIKLIFKKKPEEIIKATKFASTHCEKTINFD
tara:strand:- start:80 stop:412 length:333 start_codon:yes stop_codon:yes gene_type:complete